ncbi:MAG: hypothetical protein J6X55_15075 [Victivallales bacterium]|nr:hypothetical protein [Victivallales bacterium]
MDGIVPPEYYIDQLMKHIGRPYYVSLLTAAQLYGAAHQSPHRFCVFTILPKMSLSEAKNPVVFWGYRQRIQQQLLIKSNSETAAVNFSCPELTAVDLIQYSQYIGGLSRAATVLAELIEKTDFSKVDPILYQYTSLASFQRLGYILEDVLDEKKQADILYSCLLKTNLNFRWTSLSKQKKTDNSMARSSRWRIIINTVIEVDDL